MRIVKNHPYIKKNTVLALETDKGHIVLVQDCTKSRFGNYTVERKGCYGGWEILHSSFSVDRCIQWAENWSRKN